MTSAETEPCSSTSRSRQTSPTELLRFHPLRRSNPTIGVNTRAWEYRPTISGPWIFFGRWQRALHRRNIILFDLFSQRVVVLADRPEGPANDPSATPGQVNGNFAVWSQCTASACNVWEYDIAAGTSTRLPNATPGHFNYAPSVDTSGTVYYAHSGRSCGAVIQKRPVGDPTSIVVALHGRDVESSYFGDSMGIVLRVWCSQSTTARPAQTTYLASPRRSGSLTSIVSSPLQFDALGNTVESWQAGRPQARDRHRPSVATDRLGRHHDPPRLAVHGEDPSDRRRVDACLRHCCGGPSHPRPSLQAETKESDADDRARDERSLGWE